MEPDIKVLIADDHPIFRKGLKEAIEIDEHIQVVAEAADGEAALRLTQEAKPAVAVLDIDMPRLSGIELARRVIESELATEIIFLTMHKDEGLFNTAMDMGVKGYVLKDSAVTEIIDSIHAVFDGRHYVSPSVSSYLMHRRDRAASVRDTRPGVSALTAQEKRILKSIAESKTSREIADELVISRRTVENHRANICEKLELHGSNALLRFAIEHKSQIH